MCLHNVLFRLSALIRRFPSLCSEDEANTLHFPISSGIASSRRPFCSLQSKTSCHRYLRSTSLFIKVTVGVEACWTKEDWRKQAGYFHDKGGSWANCQISVYSLFNTKISFLLQKIKILIDSTSNGSTIGHRLSLLYVLNTQQCATNKRDNTKTIELYQLHLHKWHFILTGLSAPSST